jgi:hypothetical protein
MRSTPAATARQLATDQVDRTVTDLQEGSIVSRHQSRRRRTYGRRQHELHERRDRVDTGHLPDQDDAPSTPEANVFDVAPPLFDLFSSRMRFLEGRG